MEILPKSKLFEVNVPCSQCKKTFSVSVDVDKMSQKSNPFPLLFMHTRDWGEKAVHIMIAYIDKNANCRHVELLDGDTVFITPFIIYNPELLSVYVYRS